MRASAPASLADAPLDALLADVTAGLAERFPQVLPIEVRADPPDAQRGSVRLLHAAVDAHGEGVAVETLLRRGDGVTCWVAPATRYAAERETARRAMAGRPPKRRGETAAPEGVPVAEIRLWVTGPGGEGDWVVVRRGPGAQVLSASRAGSSDGAELPASLLPVWLASVTGTGPRPVPGRRPLLIVARHGLDRLLDGAADSRTALEAPDLTGAEAAELDALARGLTRRWSLEWISGWDDDVSPGPEARGHVEILDAGPSRGLWRVLTDLPEALTSELPGERPVGLVRTAPADVWHELTLPLTG